MSPCPRVVTYRLHDSSGVPGGVCEFVARFAVVKRNPETGKQFVDFLPMVFSGESAIGVYGAARAFWVSEQSKIANRLSVKAKITLGAKKHETAGVGHKGARDGRVGTEVSS